MLLKHFSQWYQDHFVINIFPLLLLNSIQLYRTQFNLKSLTPRGKNRATLILHKFTNANFEAEKPSNFW